MPNDMAAPAKEVGMRASEEPMLGVDALLHVADIDRRCPHHELRKPGSARIGFEAAGKTSTTGASRRAGSDEPSDDALAVRLRSSRSKVRIR